MRKGCLSGDEIFARIEEFLTQEVAKADAVRPAKTKKQNYR
jgi:hypothetical protein